MRLKSTLPGLLLSGLLLLLLGCSAAAQREDAPGSGSSLAQQASSQAAVSSALPESTAETGLVAEQVLEGETGDIHYSYFLPEGYGEEKSYPLMMTMPGYDMMWFGEDSSGANLNWRGFLCWTELPEDMVVVSAQLTDWGETSARQAVEPTDGQYAPVAENGVAVYIFMAEGDEYYGSQRAQEAYDGLRLAYQEAGWSEEETERVLQLQTPGPDWFAERGVTGNYHGGGNVVFEEASVLDWIVSHSK